MAIGQSTARRDVYALVTDQIIDLLEQGTVPWRKPWASVAPQNLVTRKAYRGINPFILACSGFSSPFWLTFRQAKQLGGHVQRGSKSAPVVFWKIFEKRVENEEGEPETVRLPVLRYFRVFNLEQCEEIHESGIPQITECEFEPIERAEEVVRSMPDRPAIENGTTGAFYRPWTDSVHMPRPEHFERPPEYYSTLFHELTHATGHESRLGRLKADRKLAAFGSQDYSKEELVAEMGAAFLCGHCSIEQRTLDNSAAYIASWLRKLKDDKRLVVVAAAQAQKAADYILGRSFQEAGVNS